MVIIWKAANIFRRWDRLSLFLFTVSRTFLCTTNKPTVFLLVEVRTKLKMGLPPRRGEHGPYFAQVKGYSANPKTIGEAIRKRRLDLDLRQIDVAKIIACHELTVVNWEKGRWTPNIKHMPGILQFLGYNPLAAGTTAAEQRDAY